MNNMTSKLEIKNAIDNFCKDISTKSVPSYINVPIIILFYMSDYSRGRINAPLQDALTSSISMTPDAYEYVLSPNMNHQHIVEIFQDAITKTYQQGKNYDDIRIAFISMMDDDFFNEEHLSMTQEIQNGFSEIKKFGMDVSRVSFYGLFDQKKIEGYDYQYAFKFIASGKHLWKNIYHIEIPFMDQVMTKQGQLIALNIIRDDYTMKQDNDKGYCWNSLDLQYLKISEFIVCRILREIYGKQINDQQVLSNEWKNHINDMLNQSFHKIIQIDHHDSYRYVPLNYQPAPTPKQSIRFNFLSQHKDETPYYSNILKDKETMKNLVSSLYKDISISDAQDKEMIKDIICCTTSLDPNVRHMASQIIDVLQKKYDEIDNELQKLQEHPINDAHISDVKEYLKKEYQYYALMNILIKQKEIIHKMIEHLHSQDDLKQIIDEIIDKNEQYTRMLDELTLSEYGGTLEEFDISDLPHFKVNQSINNILKQIDRDAVYHIIEDNESLIERLEDFLNHTLLNKIHYRHQLGEIHHEYSHIHDIQSYLLLTPVLSQNQDIKNLTSKYNLLTVEYKDIYKDNSFFIISSRLYDSERYISRYKRGD
ncbi:MAG: hypothetical protein LUF02_11230 [Erysipelotrichaceae bacterium]|nr:hypothetical protein [Erysipelotrichaceae bacterium]